MHGLMRHASCVMNRMAYVFYGLYLCKVGYYYRYIILDSVLVDILNFPYIYIIS